MPSSPWGSRLENKLAALAATSSKETLQTLAKWIAFNRKRAKTDFAPVFVQCLKDTSKQEILLGVIHEVLILNKATPSKWNRLEDLRVVLGEQVLLVASDQLSQSARDKVLQELWKEWDDVNSFGGPTVLNLLRKKLSKQTASPPAKKEPAAEEPAVKTTPAAKEPSTVKAPSPKAPVDITAKESPEKKKAPSTPAAAKPASKKTGETPIKEVSSYDFEASGIPAANVDPKEFQEPCRSIATLQIARDLRNDGAVQLSSLLSGMPQDVRAACAESAENGNKYKLDDVKARDFSLRINHSLLDMDLDEQLQNVQTFRNIVDRQRQARERLIRLLIQSRCKFGSEAAAKAFYEADRAKEELNRRKHILSDAMELEGLDVVMEDDDKSSTAKKQTEEELPPLSWYAEGEGASDTRDAKRSRTE